MISGSEQFEVENDGRRIGACTIEDRKTLYGEIFAMAGRKEAIGRGTA
jgi:hypothetical protein